MLGADFELPTGYKLADGVDQPTSFEVPFGATTGADIVVEAIDIETVVHVNFVTASGEVIKTQTARTTARGADGESWTFMLGTDYTLPDGYKLAEGVEQIVNVQLPFGTTTAHDIIVEPITAPVKETVLNLTFETVNGEVVKQETVKTTVQGADSDSWTFMLGKDFNLPNGYKLAKGVEQNTNVQVPFGASGGHTLVVEPEQAPVTKTSVKITFETAKGEKVRELEVSTTIQGSSKDSWTFMLGTDYKLPDGYKLAEGVEQTTNIQVPFGATAGHTLVVEPEQTSVTKTSVKITFETAKGEKVRELEVSTTVQGSSNDNWTFMLGTDYKLPDGYKLAEGVEQTTNIQVPFGATGGHTLVVEKVNNEKTVYVSYIDEETKMPLENAIEIIVIGAKDTYFNAGILKAIPADYELAQTGDIYVGTGDTVNVEVRKVAETKTIYVSYINEADKTPFENGIEKITVKADATYFNTSILKEVPAGYELVLTGDIYIGNNDTVNVEVRKVTTPSKPQGDNKPNTGASSSDKNHKKPVAAVATPLPGANYTYVVPNTATK